MKVATALKLFGTDVIAALELMEASGDMDFANAGTTVEFMKTMRRWWEVITL